MPNVQQSIDGGRPGSYVDIIEVGTIMSVRKAVVLVSGLPSCKNGQIVEFEGGILGMVMGFTEETVQVLVLGSPSSLHIGGKVYSKGKPLRLPVGTDFLGRVVSAMCEPVDVAGSVDADEHYPVFADAPGVMDRAPVEESMETGTMSIDAIIPIGRGQRQLLIGDRATGKTSVGLDAITSQKGKDVICVYCSIGQPHSRLIQVTDYLRDNDLFSHTVVVSGVASAPVGEQYLAPYTASMIGEYFMNSGRDVLVVFDDLTKHAWVYRQISLLLGRTPGREAYPGDIFYIHSQLMERAGRLSDEEGGGSMTFLPIVEILQGDVTGYVPTNLISMTDGQIYFSSALFKRGVKPAVDFGLSVSRIGNRAQWPAMRELSSQLRLGYLRFQELQQMSQLRVMAMSKDVAEQLKHGKCIEELIKQDKNSPVPMENQIVYLYALGMRVLDGLDQYLIEDFKREIPKFVEKENPGLLFNIRKNKTLSEETKQSMDNSIRKYFEVSKHAKTLANK